VYDSPLYLLHEVLSLILEFRNVLLIRPQSFHSSKLKLHRFFLVGGSGRRSDLGILFPSSILSVQRSSGLDVIVQFEESCRKVKCGLDVFWGDTMIAQSAEEFVSTEKRVAYELHSQEADIHRRIHELIDDLGSSLIEVS